MSSTYEQQQIVDEILETMRKNGCLTAPIQTGFVDEGVEKTISDLLLLYADSGEFLTNILKIPSYQQMVLLECICGAGEYRFGDVARSLRIHLKNIGSSPVDIHVRTQHYRVRSPKGTLTDLSHGEKIRTQLHPGESVWLSPDRAVWALTRYCKLAWDPIGQVKWPHGPDSIREIEYTFTDPTTGEARTASGSSELERGSPAKSPKK